MLTPLLTPVFKDVSRPVFETPQNAAEPEESYMRITSDGSSRVTSDGSYRVTAAPDVITDDALNPITDGEGNILTI